MRFSFAIAICLLLAACNGNHPKPTDLSGYSQKSIRLSNDLGVVSVYLPNEMDTFYTSIDYGEYHCAGIKLHRFVSKKYTCCLSTTSDFSYSDLADLSDSLYQFTIIQTQKKDCEEYVDINEDLLKSTEKFYLTIDKNAAATRKYYMTEISGRKFVISELNTKLRNTELQELDGITQADGRMVKFIFKCFCAHAGNFNERMMASMKTIQIAPDAQNK